MHVVQEPGAKILQPFGRIGKDLLEPEILDVNMADHLSFIRFESALTFYLQVDSQIGRIRMTSPRNGIPEELEDIILLQAVEMAGAIHFLRLCETVCAVRLMAVSAVCLLAERM